jgi:hypothetical protein
MGVRVWIVLHCHGGRYERVSARSMASLPYAVVVMHVYTVILPETHHPRPSTHPSKQDPQTFSKGLNPSSTHSSLDPIPEG